MAIVPPALVTSASALAGIAPPENNTRNDWAAEIALSVDVVASSDVSMPQPALENQAKAAAANNVRVGLGMRALLAIVGGSTVHETAPAAIGQSIKKGNFSDTPSILRRKLTATASRRRR